MSGEWRTHPKLAGRFHPQYPDDLQVVVHDGGPRMTDRRPEAVWVRVLSHEAGVFTGEVLNQPQQLLTVRQGDRVKFVVPESGEHPLMVRDKYLRERDRWVIHPCNRCGLSELLDAPSDLIAKVFPNLPPGEAPVMFTAFCGLCGGVRGVEQAGPADSAGADEPVESAGPPAVSTGRGTAGARRSGGGSSGGRGVPAGHRISCLTVGPPGTPPGRPGRSPAFHLDRGQVMKQCPFCMGQVPDAAVKCQHCGEWLDGRRSAGRDELGRAANRFVTLMIVMGVAGLALVLLFFFLVWLPNWNKMQRDFENFPNTPPAQQK